MGMTRSPTHLRKQGDIFFVVVVQVDGLVGRIGVLAVAGQHLFLTPRHRAAVRPKRHYIHAGQAPAILVIGPLALVGRSGAAPQKAFWHLHSSILTFRFISELFLPPLWQ